MEAKATCPAYVTGIFSIAQGDAAGAGFAIDRHLTTTVSERKSGRSSITINGIEGPSPVSKAVLRRYAELMKGKVGLLDIKHETQVPIGFGLGMSAAGAMSLSLALNEYFGAGLKAKECVKIAHDADVECGTGLSGVDAAAIGGMLARRSVKDGPVKLPFEEKEMEIAFFSPMKTAGVIHSEEWRQKVNEAAEDSLSMLFSRKSFDSFVGAARHFTAESGLGSWCAPEMEANSRASMAMLGQTLFSDKPMELARQPMLLMRAKTYEGGAKLL
ncbi:Homoserine kinase [uncultured archaeon]|nr:Homoserine kinase [uncultured archaeon]